MTAIPTALAVLVEGFFTARLMRQLRASPHTVASYRDTFRLLLQFAERRLGRTPSTLSLADLDAPFVVDFLEHLEVDRRNTARSRNARLAAIHSFCRYVAVIEPMHYGVVQRVLAIPHKRHVRRQIEFLTRVEIDAVLAVPDAATWIGRRDHALLLLAVQTGLRVSELTGLRVQDAALGHGAHVRCIGKGRKERCTPVRRETAALLRKWIAERHARPDDPLFPSTRGGRMSTDAVAYALAKHVAAARRSCATLRKKRISPHVLRRSLAMDLLLHGADKRVIALWLGHEHQETTDMYTHADLAIKQRALARTAPVGVRPGRYRPSDHILAFLQAL